MPIVHNRLAGSAFPFLPRGWDAAGHVAGRDGGWPILRRQLLVRPAFPDPGLVPFDVAGAAPATIVTNGSRADDGKRYAATLRGGGVAVQELVSDARRALPVHELARAL